ncbi:MAG: hypothetical protein AAF968_26325, partial [Pseudomonadota bacterium]
MHIAADAVFRGDAGVRHFQQVELRGDHEGGPGIGRIGDCAIRATALQEIVVVGAATRLAGRPAASSRLRIFLAMRAGRAQA